MIICYRHTSNAAALKLLDKMLKNYDRRSTPTNDMGKLICIAEGIYLFCNCEKAHKSLKLTYCAVESFYRHLILRRMTLLDIFVFTGIATNVSVELHVASLGSINTENMVIYF